MSYIASLNNFKRCGNSGLDLPLIYIFGGKLTQSDRTHFDLANNYGPWFCRIKFW